MENGTLLPFVMVLPTCHNHNLVGNCKLVEMVGIGIVVDSKIVEVGSIVEVGIEVFVGS